MAEYITPSGRVGYVVMARPAVPQPMQAANAPNAPAAAGPAGNGAVAAQNAAAAQENAENIAPRRRRRAERPTRSVRELRRRAQAVDPEGNAQREMQPRYRRVLGDMNGQQVRDLRENTADELYGVGAAASRYIDLSAGRIQDAGVLQDPYSFPSSWATFTEDA